MADDEFGDGLDDEPDDPNAIVLDGLTPDEEIELETAFTEAGLILDEIQLAITNFSQAGISGANASTLMIAAPMRQAVGDALRESGEFLNEIETTAQATTLNEVGDAILQSGVEDFLEPLADSSAEFCRDVQERFANNSVVLAAIQPEWIFILPENATDWVINNGLLISLWVYDQETGWFEQQLYQLVPPIPADAVLDPGGTILQAGNVREFGNRWQRLMVEQRVEFACDFDAPPSPVPPPPVAVPPPPGVVPPLPPVAVPPPAAGPPPGPVPGPLPPGVIARWCGRDFVQAEFDRYYGAGWTWHDSPPELNNPRLPTPAPTQLQFFNNPNTEAGWAALKQDWVLNFPDGVPSEWQFNQWASWHRVPTLIPIGWKQIDDSPDPLREGEAWVVVNNVTDKVQMWLPPGFEMIVGGVLRTRIACDNAKPVVVPPPVGAGGGGVDELCEGTKIEICGWGDLLDAIGGGPNGKAGSCQLWKSCDSEVIYTTSRGQSPRSPDDERVDASELDISDLEAFIASCKGLDAPGKNGDSPPFKPGRLGNLEVETGCDVLPAAAIMLDSDFAKPLLDFFQGFIPEDLKEVNGVWDFIRWLFPAEGSFSENLKKTWVPHADKMFRKFMASEGCDDPRFWGYKSVEVALGFFQRWLGGGFDDALKAVTQQSRFFCPISVPSPENATQAFLADTIDRETMECWTRAGGMMPEGWNRVVLANRQRLGVSELVNLWRRGEISEGEFDSRCRQLGFLNQSEYDEFKELSVQVPPVSDLTRFMVRDTADPRIVEAFDLDHDFIEHKFKGKVKEWAADQGVDEDYMRHVWRAHWTIPAPGQLFTMFHRLRNNPDPDLKTDLETVKTALEQQDILPFWINRFLEVSFRPLNRVDTRRARNVGAIDRAGVFNAYTNQGYSDANAEILTTFSERVREIRWLKHPAVRQYSQGAINGAELEVWTVQEGAEPDDVAAMKMRGLDMLRSDTTFTCVKAIEKRFQHGEFGPLDLNTQLTSQGLDFEQVNELVKKNECELVAGGKRASISQLCTWFKEGNLEPEEFFARLKQLGWDEDDAVRIIRDCTIQRELVLSREQAQRLRESLRRSRAQEAENARFARDLEKRRNQALRASRSASAKRKRVAALLVKAAGQYAKRFELDSDEALVIMRTILAAIKADSFFTDEEIGRAMVFQTKASDTQNANNLGIEIAEVLELSIIPQVADG